MRPAELPARLRGAAGLRRAPSPRPTASTGATTRCTTRRPRAPTRPSPTARRARASSARWSRASTAPACAWSWTSSTTTRRPPARTRSRCSTGSCPATTSGSTPASGAVETSTCCANTATEHRMMEKLMIDSVVTWAREYKVDGFRFDLMGHQLEGACSRARALDALTLARRRGRPARSTSTARAGTSARSRTTRASCRRRQLQHGRHRHRDVLRPPARRRPRRRAVRRRPAHPGLRLRPVHRPERRSRQRHARTSSARGCCSTRTRSRSGWPATCATTAFVDRTGATVKGSQVDYNGQPAGYAADPSETITYVEAHDNETLFDALAVQAAAGDARWPTACACTTLALATTALAQGPSFWHAGADLLRSKSLDRNSYNSGDWFNRIDWSGARVDLGLRPAARAPTTRRSGRSCARCSPTRRSSPARPTCAPRASAPQELLRIRFSSPLFRLGSARADPGARVVPDRRPGPDARRDRDGDRRPRGRDRDLRASWSSSTPHRATTQTVAGARRRRYRLHPVQAHGGDPVVRRGVGAHDRRRSPCPREPSRCSSPR